MMYVLAGKKELKEYAKQCGLKIISGMEDTNRKRVMGVLGQRHNEALDVLDFVKVKTQAPYTPTEKNKKAVIESIIISPIVSLLLSAIAASFTVVYVISGNANTANVTSGSMNTLWLLPLLFIMLLLAQAFYRLRRDAKDNMPIQPLPEAEMLLDTEKAKIQLEKEYSKLMNDSEAICALFLSNQQEGMNVYEDELVKLYISLFEAKVDRPECEEFNYSLTMAEMMLSQIGLKPVHYSEERKNLFTIEKEDYQDEMRYPAIVREKNGEVVKKVNIFKT